MCKSMLLVLHNLLLLILQYILYYNYLFLICSYKYAYMSFVHNHSDVISCELLDNNDKFYHKSQFKLPAICLLSILMKESTVEQII